jgi:hypothetical protein
MPKTLASYRWGYGPVTDYGASEGGELGCEVAVLSGGFGRTTRARDDYLAQAHFILETLASPSVSSHIGEDYGLTKPAAAFIVKFL